MRHLELDEPRHLNQGKPNIKGNKGRIRLERADRRVALEPINLLRPIELNPRFELRVDDQAVWLSASCLAISYKYVFIFNDICLSRGPRDPLMGGIVAIQSSLNQLKASSLFVKFFISENTSRGGSPCNYWKSNLACSSLSLRFTMAIRFGGAPSYAESFEPDARGVGHGLESCIWVRVSRSKVYLVWVKTRAVDVRLASIPKQEEEMKITKIFHGEVRTQSLNESRYSFWLPL